MRKDKNRPAGFAKGVLLGTFVGAALALRYVYSMATAADVVIPRETVRVRDLRPSRRAAIDVIAIDDGTNEPPSLGRRLARVLLQLIVVVVTLRNKRR